MALALRILIHPTEADRPHQLDLRLQDGDGEPVAQLQIEFGVDSDASELEPGEHASLPIPLTLPWTLPHPGVYSFELLIDGIHQTSVPFRVIEGGGPE